jgi:hypothetical protein
MEAIIKRRIVSCAKTSVLGLALLSFAACNSGETTTATPAPGSSAGFTGPLAFINNTGDKTLTSVGLKGDSGNVVVDTIPATEFENVALGDMQMSDGNWVFVNLTAAGKVAAIDPLTAATPIHRVNLPAGTRTVHIYRDANNGEVIWSMNDGNEATATNPGDDVVNCATQTGGSVTVMHNSHLGPGANPPTVLRTTCVLADGHKVTAFSSGDGVPKRAFVSSETAGEIAVIDDEEGSPTYLQMIHRIDLCNQTKENALPSATRATCNTESATGTTPFTPNNSTPHGIRWSKLTKKIYSFQEEYGQFAEIDPAAVGTPGGQIITKTIDLPAPYTTYGISPDGRYLLLRGETTSPQTMRLGVIDLSATNPVVVNLTNPELDGTTIGSFTTGSASIKFSPDGKRLYLLVGNSALATVTKKDRLFAYDASTLSASTPALTLLPNGEISLLQTGRHSMDVLAQGAGEAKYIVVSNNGSPGSVSIINATDNTIKETVTVGTSPGAVMVYQSGAAEAGNQASN